MTVTRCQVPNGVIEIRESGIELGQERSEHTLERSRGRDLPCQKLLGLHLARRGPRDIASNRHGSMVATRNRHVRCGATFIGVRPGDDSKLDGQAER